MLSGIILLASEQVIQDQKKKGGGEGMGIRNGKE